MENISTIDKQAKQWAMIAHVSGLVVFLGIPLGNVIAPLVVWLMKRETSPFVDEAGKESLNFQISMTIYGLLVGALCFVFIGFLLVPVLLVADVVLVIKATMAADKGQGFHYPFTIRFVK